jgi:hypothetical protein
MLQPEHPTLIAEEILSVRLFLEFEFILSVAL